LQGSKENHQPRNWPPRGTGGKKRAGRLIRGERTHHIGAEEEGLHALKNVGRERGGKDGGKKRGFVKEKKKKKQRLAKMEVLVQGKGGKDLFCRF